ncbi:MAG: HAD-IIA family hydrolase [Alphaproteobacteria bacterium]|nr:HAD-IIA family hydrolase [Alphaproteobacteria bacterium]
MNNYAIILAAGIGSRLYPITQEMPKSLVKVNAREILDYQIQGYVKSGIKEENIFIVTGYKHEMIAEYLQNNYPKVKEIYSPDYLSTNNMYSLYLGLNSISKIGFDKLDFLFINNADCLYDEALMYEFVNSEYKNAIACDVGTYIEESMKVIIKDDNSLINIAKTITADEGYGVSVDLYKYSSKTVSRLFEIVKDFIEIKKDLKQWTEVAFPELFKTEKVFPFDIKGKKWVEVDNNEDLLLADKLFSNFNINEKKALICDMDGTIYLGNQPVDDAINFIKNNNRLQYYFLTNNTSKTPSDYVNKLASYGIEAKESDILTPLYVLEEYLKDKKYKSIYLMANKKVSEYLALRLPNIKFEFKPDRNEAVVLTYDSEINYSKMKEMSFLLNNSSVEYIATHHDIVCPTENGPVPDIGCFITMFEQTTKKKPDIILGKPFVNIASNILKQYKTENIAVVGDRLYTDKKLADNLNCDFICVLSGETKRIDIQSYEGTYPSIVVDNLGEIE